METFNVGTIGIQISSEKVIFEQENHSRISIASVKLPNVLNFLRSFDTDGPRRSFRVPATDHDLVTSIKFGDNTFGVDPVDLSLTDICVSSPELRKEGYVRAIVGVSIGLVGDQLSLLGEIRQILGDRIDIGFLALEPGGQQGVPDELDSIYRSLETQWLRDAIDIE